MDILKAKLKKENSELVSAANQLKLMFSEGTKYLTATFDYKQVDEVTGGDGE
jgi:hypothetical protein